MKRLISGGTLALILATANVTEAGAVARKPAAPGEERQSYTVTVDEQGVMRRSDNGEEVSYYGTNYTVPFAYSYRALGYLGRDRREAIDRDIYHIARLGLNAFRLHLWDAELADGGLMLLNTRRAVDDPRVVAIDADGISAAVLGRPIPNTVFLGAIPAVCGAVSLHDVHEGIRATMPARLHEKNVRIVDAALASRPDLPHLGGLGQRGGDSGTGLFDLAAAVLLEGEGSEA